MPLTANEIWRDFESGPATPAHKPIKSDIRAWGTALEALGGFNAAGADTAAALFSGGVGVAPIWRKIVGFDLPNPSLTTPGGIFAKPGASGQIVSGIREDGGVDLHAVTGSGSLVLQNNPNFIGSIFFGGLQFLGPAGGTHAIYGPDGRLGIQLAAGQNFYKASTGHYFYNQDGSDEYGHIDTKGLFLSPFNLVGALADPVIKFSQTWNTTAQVGGAIDIQIIKTAAHAASRALRIRSGPLGNVEVFGVYADENNPSIIMRDRSVIGAPPSFSTIIYSAPAGVSFNNSAGSAFLTLISDLGVWSFYGGLTGTHTIAAAANASGASTLPNVSGELINTGFGVPTLSVIRNIDFNAVAGTEIQLPINLPSGFTRFRLAAFAQNTGPGAASLTTVQVAIYTATGAGGTAVCLPQGLSAIISNSPGTPGVYANLTINPAVGNLHYFNVGSVPTLFARITTPQGAAALGQIGVQVIAFP